MPAESSDRVTLARILRPRGTRGEVAAEILTDFPERLTKLREVFLWDGANAASRAVVRKCWLSSSRGGQAIFLFEGVDSIAAAEQLRGLEVQVPLAERVKLPTGRYYISELVGCEVFELATTPATARATTPATTSPERIGTVRDVQLAGTPLLVVESPQGELLIPLAEEICTRVDTLARRIEVVLPEGLRELNRE
ncbi:MAG TPA: ribosome maturation factor RimM [Candidatus Acidoferrales bacterium]|nr:ribosome maturation factor RimM [Candidatus Acidoferrales bacterium]